MVGRWSVGNLHEFDEFHPSEIVDEVGRSGRAFPDIEKTQHYAEVVLTFLQRPG
jgi:hypothetical protein